MTSQYFNWAQMAWIGNVLYWILLIGWVSTSNQPSDFTYVTSCVLISVSAGFIILNPWQSNHFEPLKLVAFLYGTSFGLGPLLLAPVGVYRFSYLGGAWERLLSEGAILALIGFFALLIGYYGCFRRKKRDLDKVSIRSLSCRERIVMTLAGLGVFGIGAASYLILIASSGGITHFLYYTGGRADIFGGVFGGFYWASFFMVSGLCIVGCAQVAKHPVVVAALSLGIAIIFVPFQGREEVIAPAVCGLLMIHYGYRRVSLRWIGVAVCVLMIVASLLAFFRNSDKSKIYQNAEAFADTYSDNLQAHLTKTLATNIEQMDAFLIAVRYVEKTNQTLGGSTLMNWLEPIKRHVLGEILESEHPGRFMTILINPEHRWSQTALSPSILGELYINFSWIGLVFGLFLYGASIRFLTNKVVCAHADPRTLMFYPYTIWIVSKMVIDGTVHLFRPFIVLLPILVTYLIIVMWFGGKQEIASESLNTYEEDAELC